MRLAHLYRYPVKGLSPEPLAAADLPTEGYFPCDRLFALENGPSGFDSQAPAHQPKIKFLMLMKNGALAGLATRYCDDSGVLAVSRDGREVARGDLRSPEGRAAIEAFLSDYLGEEQIRGPVKLLEAPEGFRFTDSKSGFISLINLASVAEIGKAQGARIDPLRFRGNLYIDGVEAWAEAAWPGRKLRIGDVTLDVLKMIDRCAATGVEPGTGQRDMDIVQTIRMNFGHIDCGVYARIEEGGRIAVGDALTLL
jgi:uncharacterized protein